MGRGRRENARHVDIPKRWDTSHSISNPLGYLPLRILAPPLFDNLTEAARNKTSAQPETPAAEKSSAGNSQKAKSEIKRPPVLTSLNAAVEPPAYDPAARRRKPGRTEGSPPKPTTIWSDKSHKSQKDVSANNPYQTPGQGLILRGGSRVLPQENIEAARRRSPSSSSSWSRHWSGRQE